MKLTEREKKNTFILGVAVFLFLIFAATYYLVNQEKIDKRTGLVGDSVCGNFADAEDRNSCCANAYEGFADAGCAGSWMYLEGIEQCQFVCQGEFPSCSEDLKECPNGIFVSRNPDDGCNFHDCGVVDNEDAKKCALAGGEWKLFNDGCVDSCSIQKNPDDVFCTQALTWGCECGEEMCWNSGNESCEKI